MKYIFLTILVLFIFFGLLSQEQEPNNFTLSNVVRGAEGRFYPEKLYYINWHEDGEHFIYVRKNILKRESVKDGFVEDMLTLEQLNGKLDNRNVKKMSFFPELTWINDSLFSFMADHKYIEFNISLDQVVNVIDIHEDAENIVFSANHNYIFYTVKNNLVLLSKNGIEKQISTDTSPSIINGQEVHRREFGINTGIFPSPHENYVAFYRKDERKVSSYPLVDIENRVATLKNIKYPMAGMQSQEVKVCVYDIISDEILEIKTTGDKEYLTCITWSPDEECIYIALLNRDQDHLTLNCYDVQTGKLQKQLFEEKHAKYVEPQHPLYFLNGNDGKFIWQSQRDGFNHLYLYDTSGVLIKQITKGPWLVSEYLGTDKTDRFIFYIATKETPLERHVYKSDLETGQICQLSGVPGIHSAVFNREGSFFIDSYNSTDIPGKVDLINGEGEMVRNVITADNPLKQYVLGERSVSTIKAADGETPLFYRLIKPVDFDPDNKYPVIIYVYGGPHNQLVLNEWPGRTEMWQQYLAQNGYVSFTLDNRGSSGRGLEFENSIYRELGYHEMADQIEGIKFLCGKDFVDTSRVGIYGWSYGGYMATSLMLHYPDVYKVGVAGGPVINWKYYEVMYGERYMDTPDTNPEGYAKTNLLNYVNQLKGKLLIIHGAMDPIVVWQHSLLFVKECIDYNKQVDYFIYPTHEHNVTGKNRVHLMQKVTNYFEDHL